MKLFLSKHWKPVALAISIVLLISFGALTSAQAQPRTTPAPPSDPSVLSLNPEIYVESRPNIELVLLPDLVITSLSTNQAGYQECSDWEVTVEVTNIGLGSARLFGVWFGLGRQQGPGIWFGNTAEGALTSYPLDEVNSLDPGESVTLVGPDAPFDNLCTFQSPISLVPDHSLVYLAVYADGRFQTDFDNSGVMLVYGQGGVEESNEENNLALSTFGYPAASLGESYDPSLDEDGDGFYPPWPEDCDDTNPLVHEEAEEIPGDGIDNNCDGFSAPYSADFHPPGWSFEYPHTFEGDNDNDGFSPADGDCNDLDASINPEALEIGNELDDDCDGIVDEGVYGIDFGHVDLDGDGFSLADGDCNDLNSSTFPNAPEILDGQDNDCDGFVDEWLATPDWSISEFTITRDVRNCSLFTLPDPNTTLFTTNRCGFDINLTLENLGEDMGEQALNQVADSIFISDLVNQFTLGNFRIVSNDHYHIPFYVFENANMIDLMACGPIGLFAVIPGGAGGGPLGEENISNNWAVAYPEPGDLGRDLDISFGEVLVFYPEQEGNSGGITVGENSLRVTPKGMASGACPPPTLMDFTTQMRLIHNGSQIYEGEINAEMHFDETGFASQNPGDRWLSTQFGSRPSNGDEIVIDLQLNSDENIIEYTGNNHCTITFSYDHAFGLNPWRNDRLVFEDAQGCSVSYRGENYGIGSVSQTLGGDGESSGLVLIAILGLALLGGGLGWRLAPRLGLASKTGLVIVTLAGAVVGGYAGFGAANAFINGNNLSSSEEIVLLQEDPAVSNLPVLFQEKFGGEPDYCSQYASASANIEVDDQGSLSDILIDLQPGSESLPEGGRYRITLWNDEGLANTIVTESNSVSLASMGLLAELGVNIVWQLEVEIPALPGGDLYISPCVPELRTFSLASYLEHSEALSALGERPFFESCDPDDSDCHILAHLVFRAGDPFIALDLLIRKDLVDQAPGLNVRLLTSLEFLQDGEQIASIEARDEALAALQPNAGPVEKAGVAYYPYTFFEPVPTQITDFFDVLGEFRLQAAASVEGERQLDNRQIRAEHLDPNPPLTPTATPTVFVPTPTFTPTVVIPTPSYTVAPPSKTPVPADKQGPKVSGPKASPDPALTTSPVTISAKISDPSGVDSALVYYRKGKNNYQLAGPMKAGGGNSYTLNIGSLTPAGSYDFRILASDKLGNTRCSPSDVADCPGGSFQVNIP